MGVVHQFAWVTVTGDTVVHTPGSDGTRLAPDSGSTPRVIGLNSNLSDGAEFCIHNLSGGPITLVHRSGNAGSEDRKLVLTGLGGDFAMANGTILWGIKVDPNDAVLSDSDRGCYVDDGGQVPFVRAKTAASTASPTTSSGTPAVIPEMSVTVTTTGGDAIVSFSGSFDLHSGDAGTVQLYVDGSAVPDALRTLAYTGSQGLNDPPPSVGGATLSFAMLAAGLAAGEHTFEARWAATAGSLRAIGTQRSVYVVEVPA